jgi:hypothetical protein
MTIRIFEARKSWIWFDAHGAFLTAPQGDGLGRRAATEVGYADLLARAKDGSGPLTLPWPPGAGLFNGFWRRYLEGAPDDVGATAAWKHLTPLRLAVPVGDGGAAADAGGLRVEPGAIPCERLTLEAFLYPHGLGLVATVYLRQVADLPATVERARECSETVAPILADGEARRGPFKLSLLAAPLFAALHTRTGGPGQPEDRSGPFSIATLVNGEVDPGEAVVRQNGSLHRALVGLGTGDPYWADTAAPALAAPHLLETRRGPQQHLLLADDDYRVVWFPKAFRASAQRTTALGCYHTNLTRLSLQVASLLALARLAHADLAAQRRVRSGRMEDLARLAVLHLGRLYGRTDDTYRSASAPAQIDAGGGKAVVDDVRKSLGAGPPLHR